MAEMAENKANTMQFCNLKNKGAYHEKQLRFPV